MKSVTLVFFLGCTLHAMSVRRVQKDSVIVNVPHTQKGLNLGQTLQIKRQISDPNFLVDIGTIKIAQLGDGFALAHVLENGTEAGSMLQPKSNEIRVGDIVMYPPSTIEARLALLPTIETSFHDLFADPRPVARSFEVPPHRLQDLKEKLKPIAQAHLSKILIEVHTDHQRNSSESEYESIQRASALRQLLIRVLNVDEQRIVALGFGSSDPKVDKNHPLAESLNRRVIIKAID